MREIAKKYLEKDLIMHLDMITAMSLDGTEILYANEDGVLLFDTFAETHFLSCTSEESGVKILKLVDKSFCFAIRESFMVDHIVEKFKFKHVKGYLQSGYLSKEKVNVGNTITFKNLDESYSSIMREHYTIARDEYIDIVLKERRVIGGFVDGVLIGFVGTHLEGSMGMLEIFPEYRRFGYGRILAGENLNRVIDGCQIPYCQVLKDNIPSINLQKQANFTISDREVIWLSRAKD